MKRFMTILVVVLVLATAALASLARAESDGELLQRVETYLNGITTLEARFTQDNYDGSTSAGDFQLKRPMLARIAYDDPATEVVARGQKYQFWDAETGQFFEGPVTASPMWVLLRPDVDLDESFNVRALRRDGDRVFLTIQSSDDPGAGVLTLVFDDPAEGSDEAGDNEDKLALVQWYVRDAQGYMTHVSLEEVALGVPLADDLFAIDHREKIRPGTSSH